ncbi:hypothetical protein DFH09DRAFT_1361497 [Mycena vulgaris]|nr:hypothetical protein DFH09DRAFT_1361497 [Mycena vulgaris]
MAAGRPLIRNEDFSFSEGFSDPSVLALIYALANIPASELHSKLTGALATIPLSLTHEKVESLLHAFQDVGVPVAAARAAVKYSNLRHCVRCHNDYYEQNNGLQACLIGHDSQVLDVRPPFTAQYQCCPSPLELMPPHFLGRHTTRTAMVHYNYANIRKCEDNPNCLHFHALREISSSSSPADCSTSELGEYLDAQMEEAEMEETETEAAESEASGSEAGTDFGGERDVLDDSAFIYTY